MRIVPAAVGRVQEPARCPAARDRPRPSAKRSSWSCVVTSSSSARRNGSTAPRARSPAADDRVDEAGAASRRPDADAVHPRVDLHVHADVPAVGGDRGAVERGRRVQRRRQAGVERHDSEPARELRQHQDRRLDPGVAKPGPSSTSATPARWRPPRAPRARPRRRRGRTPSAFTTAISSTPSGFSVRTLCRIASRSTSTQVGRGRGHDVPPHRLAPPPAHARRRRLRAFPRRACPAAKQAREPVHVGAGRRRVGGLEPSGEQPRRSCR